MSYACLIAIAQLIETGASDQIAKHFRCADDIGEPVAAGAGGSTVLAKTALDLAPVASASEDLLNLLSKAKRAFPSR